MDLRWDRRARTSSTGACGARVLHDRGAHRRPRGDPAPPAPPANAVLAWLRSRSADGAAQFSRLTAIGCTLAETFAGVADLGNARQRLAFVLFLEYAREQGLSAGEAAMLLPDALGMSLQAADALVGQRARPAASAA